MKSIAEEPTILMCKFFNSRMELYKHWPFSPKILNKTLEKPFNLHDGKKKNCVST